MILGYFTNLACTYQYVLIYNILLIYSYHMDIQQNIFNRMNIESVIFDLDDTLFLTQKYYSDEIQDIARYVLEITNDNSNTVQTISDKVVQKHHKQGKPVLINTLIQSTLLDIYGKDIKRKEEIFKYIDRSAKKFYKNIPQLRQGTLEVLNKITNINIPIGIYSHAQNDWTERKVKYIQKMYLEKYDEEIKIPFYSTPIEKKKDEEGWRDAFKAFNFNPESTLVVGDNLQSDILPAKNIGVRNLVMINSQYNGDSNSQEMEDIIRIQDIDDLLYL